MFLLIPCSSSPRFPTYTSLPLCSCCRAAVRSPYRTTLCRSTLPARSPSRNRRWTGQLLDSYWLTTNSYSLKVTCMKRLQAALKARRCGEAVALLRAARYFLNPVFHAPDALRALVSRSLRAVCVLCPERCGQREKLSERRTPRLKTSSCR